MPSTTGTQAKSASVTPGGQSMSMPLPFAAFLAALPVQAHAQYVPMWALAALLSPLLVVLLCVVLGWLQRSFRVAALHFVIVLVWIVLFGVASYWVENDYVIWTPLALYFLHAGLLVVLIVIYSVKRMRGNDQVS